MRTGTYSLVLGLLCMYGCSTADHTASYRIDEVTTLQLQLETIHPYLDEYERTAVLVRKGKPNVHQTMMLDSGGYSATNLYRCGSGTFLLVGYFDVWKIDSIDGLITEGDCADRIYLGVFDGSSRRPWQFHPASLRQELDLVPSGG